MLGRRWYRREQVSRVARSARAISAPALVLLVGAGLAVGQATGEPSAVDGPLDAAVAPAEYGLRVTGERVGLRALPDVNSALVARLPRGFVLRAVGAQHGWHRVVPPGGVFSYVSGEYVDRRSETEGVVSLASGNLRVRVGSLAVSLKPEQSDVQTTLPLGTRVRIVGSDGEWLRIVPPDGVRLYINAEYVDRIEAAELAVALREQGSLAVAPNERPTPTTAPAGPDLNGPWGRRLLAVEQGIEEQDTRPALERNWDAALEALASIARQREEPHVARLAAEWMRTLRQRQADQAVLREAQAILADKQRDSARLERELEQIRRAREQARDGGYAARGAVIRSATASGDPRAPRYALQDPVTRRIVAYLRPVGNVGLEAWAGRYVGVHGTRTASAELGADVIDVTRVEGLQAPATEPPRQQP